jgi:hypothetical protein
MRSFLLALLTASAPIGAAAQVAPRSLALELGITQESGPDAALRAPVGLEASWWIAEGLDLTARVAWAAAGRTGDRGADARFEAGGGLRWAPGAARLRPILLADVSLVEAFGSLLVPPRAGARLRVGVGLEAFLTEDVALCLVASGGGTVLEAGTASAETGLTGRVVVWY